ncbi:ExeA family protein [Pseudomonadota bacterium]
MYNKHFGLNKAPFMITPDSRHFFGGGQRAAILDTLIYAVNEGEGIIKVTGEIGTGKTMLCRMLQDRLPDSVEVVYLANPGLGENEIIAAIAIELQLSVSPETPRLHLRQLLRNYLLQAHHQGRQVVVFVEEAQRMPLETLEEIRLLANLETGRSRLLQLVLFGQPELDQLLDNYNLRQLKDRITHSFNLDPLSAAEVRDYVRFRLHSAGYTGKELFTAPAYKQLVWSSRGLIRRLNVLADKAMLAAFAGGAERVHWIHAHRAAGDDRPSTQRGSLPKGLATGLLAGFALAVATLQLINRAPDAVPAAKASAPVRISQNIDNIRQAALNMKPAAGLPLTSARLRATQDKLLNTAAGGLTIQLLLSDDDDLNKVEKILRTQDYADLLADIYLYRSEVSGRQRWHLLYGDFDSKSKALDVLANLPEKVLLQRPYLRSLSALQIVQPSVGRNAHEDENG